jgi:hypothetical protein
MMTIKRKIVVGLDDVKAVAFECLKTACGGKVSAPPDAARIPEECPSCKTAWRDREKKSQLSETSQETNFIEALKQLRKNGAAAPPPFRIFLEFEDAPGAIELIIAPLTKAA